MDGKILSLFRKGSLLRQMWYGGYEDFDNANGGVWKKYINIPIVTIPSEYAQYLIEIDTTNVSVYNAKGDLKAQASIASEFWDLVRSDGYDIRAFDHLFNQLWFWVEEFDYTNKIAKIWVKLPENSEELNIAYGNPSAMKSTYENGEYVFEFFDDFNDQDISDYTVVEGGFVVEQRDTNDYYMKSTRPATETSIAIHSTAKTNADVVFEFEVVALEDAGRPGILFNYFDNDNYLFTRISNDEDQLQIWEKKGGSYTKLSYTAYTISTNTWYKLRTIWKSDKTIILQLLDNLDNVLAETQTTHTLDVAENSFGARHYGLGGLDNLRILKLADPATFATPRIIEF